MELQVAPTTPLGAATCCCCSTQSLIHSWYLYGPRLEHVAPTILGGCSAWTVGRDRNSMEVVGGGGGGPQGGVKTTKTIDG